MHMKYGAAQFNHYTLVSERNEVKWPYKARTHSLSTSVLEDEISELRKKMEEAFAENNSFTAEIVIEISRMLDLKINEYMNINEKS